MVFEGWIVWSSCANDNEMIGTNANIDSGLWLHHMVSFVKGPGRWDPTCYG